MALLLLRAVLAAFIGYLLGSANTSLIVGRFYGVDVRKHGSGNAGMTNTLRTMGKLPALLVIIGDILKGVLSCVIGYYILKDAGSIVSFSGVGDIDNMGLLAGGIGAIVGHNWPLYFGFKGGKGILTTFAVVMMSDPLIGLILLGIFIIIVAITRYVSLGSIIAAALFPVAAGVLSGDMIFVGFAGVIGLLAILRHHSNIGRLLKGTESKLGVKKA
ncbi:MAG: glycerol-3-phosphate 1-O-acyltransferase PlsY [Bacillota bacterium]